MRVLVAIPALNEEDTICAVVKEIKANFPHDVIVIDDGSSDLTGELALKAGANLLTHPYNMGVGAAMRSAFVFAKNMDYDIVIQVDADGQHLPTEMQKLIDALISSDIILGSRLIENTSYEFSKPRRIAISTLSGLLKMIGGEKIYDPTSGFRGANKKAVRVFSEYYPSEYLGDTVISLLVASRFNLKISEISVEMKQRQGGRPSQKVMMSVFLLMRVILVLTISKFRKLEN
jgi:glycosyltransferase involved in cell wall biosynthesis